jgi:hypothetical protein
MRKQVLTMALAAAALIACGGGDEDAFKDPGTGSGGGGGNNPPGTLSVQMGSPAGAGFQAGMLQLSSTSLSAGGSATVSVVLQQSDGTLYTGTADVSFNSPCAAQNQATITSPVSTTNGVASTTYVANGCSGEDVITAAATVNGTALQATGTVTITPAAIGSIQFISATPTNIALRGTGGAGRQETSTVIFRVVDASGGPRPGAQVTFSLESGAGGVFLTPAAGTPVTSDANGEVRTVVNSGTLAASVRVTATVADPLITTQSSLLTITTGIPDSNSISLAVECPNVEAYNVDGVEVPVVVRMADRFNNPVPNGTAVTFTASGGVIGEQCTTTAGACTVNWISSDPRPQPTSSPPSLLPGRVVILATAIGEDSFTDNNSNGFYDAGESFADLGEPFRNDDESVAPDYQLGEFFYDFNNNGVRDASDGAFSGVTCTGTGASATCNLTTTGLGSSARIIMSTSGASISGPSSATVSVGGTLELDYTVEDLNGNPMPQGTTIATTLTGSIGQLAPPSSFTVPCMSAPGAFPVSLFLAAPTSPGSGVITLVVTSPGGIVTSYRTTITVTP